jgi:hypothetical protein
MVNIWLILGKDMVIILGQYMVTLKQRQKPVRTASIAWSMVMVSVGLTYVGYGGDIYICVCVCVCSPKELHARIPSNQSFWV